MQKCSLQPEDRVKEQAHCRFGHFPQQQPFLQKVCVSRRKKGGAVKCYLSLPEDAGYLTFGKSGVIEWGAGDCPGQYYCRLGCVKKWGRGGMEEEGAKTNQNALELWSGQSRFGFKWFISFSSLLLEYLTCFYSCLYCFFFLSFWKLYSVFTSII